jgi:hypothetical protein
LEKLVTTVRPEFRADVLVFDPRDPVFGGACCSVSGCVCTAGTHGLCSAHHQRWWRQEGKPDLERFIATTDSLCGTRFGTGPLTDAVPPFETTVELAGLGRQLKLEDLVRPAGTQGQRAARAGHLRAPRNRRPG